MIMEALNVKIMVEDAQAQKEADIEAKRRQFTNTRDKTSEVARNLEQYR